MKAVVAHRHDSQNAFVPCTEKNEGGLAPARPL